MDSSSARRQRQEPIIDASSGSPGESVDLKPWAAYVLGHNLWTVRMWHQLAWTQPGLGEEVWDNVPLAVDQMRRAKIILANEIGTNVFQELERVLTGIEELNRDMELGWDENGQYRGHEFGTAPCFGEGHWTELSVLVEQALVDGETCQCWFDLGASVGRCRWDAWSGPTGVDCLPDPTAIVNAAAAIPVSEWAGVPIVESIAREAKGFRRDRRPRFFRKLIKRHPAIWAFGSEPSKSEPGNWQISSLLTGIDGAVQDGLQVVPSRAPAFPHRTQRPVWDPESGEVRIGDRVVRNVRRGVAENIILVLDTFQECRWARRVDSPFPPGDDKLGEAVRSLNKKLEMIRFKCDGTGEGVEWFWNDSAP